jgi:hypothetical protein
MINPPFIHRVKFIYLREIIKKKIVVIVIGAVGLWKTPKTIYIK